MSDTSTKVSEKIKKTAVQHALWRKGNLKWILQEHQKPLYEFMSDEEEKVTVILSARQIGKSYTLFVHALEFALKNPKSSVLFVAPTRQMCREIIRDKMAKILESCPDDLKPDWYERDFAVVLKNGSRISLLGTEMGSGDRIRGRTLNRVYIDEAGFTKDLNNLVRSVIMPTLSTTGGKMILASTPPKSKNHDMIGYIRDAQFKNKLHIVTIYDNPMVSEEMLQAIIKQCGGESSEEFRREYLAEIIVNEESLVVPEFTPSLENEIVVDLPRPGIYTNYVAMDVGFMDNTAVLFAYYDFKHARVVIEDEFVVKGKTTDVIAQGIKYKESELWTNEDTGEFQEPYKRVSDTNLLLIADLERLHNLIFETTKKDNKDAAINEMRMMIQERRVIISPKCTHLLNELRVGEWNASGKDFRRLPNGSHCDALMALVYLLRSIDYQYNPYPNSGKAFYSQNTFYRGGKMPEQHSISDDNPFKRMLANQFKKR